MIRIIMSRFEIWQTSLMKNTAYVEIVCIIGNVAALFRDDLRALENAGNHLRRTVIIELLSKNRLVMIMKAPRL